MEETKRLLFQSEKANEEKIGKPATKIKRWIYFTAVDRMLSACVEENYE